ncbi:MAG: hypothetical protein ABIO79_08230 [Ferruginibacter sp.]
MNEYLNNLKQLYSTVPNFEDGTARDLRKVFDEYISIFVHISIIDKYKNPASQLNEGFEDIDTLISASIEASTKEQKELFFRGASNKLKGDIKSLIEIIN